jgi:hypothetical protein
MSDIAWGEPPNYDRGEPVFQKPSMVSVDGPRIETIEQMDELLAKFRVDYPDVQIPARLPQESLDEYKERFNDPNEAFNCLHWGD